ncbi:uncharacterized protein TNCV_4169921 [Trichonephila clavipes]|nr:uncharacterized protein TNCV_4169921 [Trichonephila clavipes]
MQLKEKAKDYWKKILDKLTGKDTRSVDIYDADFNLFEVFNKLKKYLKEKFNADELKEKVENLFGKGSELAEQIINMLKTKGEKGKSRILEWIDKILGEKEEKRSIKDIYEKIKNYFKDLGIDLKEKFTKFGEWAKSQYEKGLEKSKDKLENVKNIAKKFLEDSKRISKDVAEEALEFFREYKEDLGKVYDELKEKAKNILKE